MDESFVFPFAAFPAAIKKPGAEVNFGIPSHPYMDYRAMHDFDDPPCEWHAEYPRNQNTDPHDPLVVSSGAQ